MATRRFPKRKYQRQLAQMEFQLKDWAQQYWYASQDLDPSWLQRRFIDRYEQLFDVAHTVERARHDLDVLPRLS